MQHDQLIFATIVLHTQFCLDDTADSPRVLSRTVLLEPLERFDAVNNKVTRRSPRLPRCGIRQGGSSMVDVD